MNEPVKTEVSFNDSVNVVIETKEKKEKRFCGLTPFGLDVFKWIVGTFLFTGIGLFISYRHNQSDEDLARYNSDVKLITSLKLDTSLDAQYAGLLSIRPFIITDSIKKIVNNRLDTIYKSLHTPLKLTKFVNENSAKSYRDTLSKPVVNKLKYLAYTSSNLKSQQPLSSLKNKEDSIAGALIPHSLDSVANKKLFEANITSTNLPVSGYEIQGIPQTLWCKKGYYVEYNNTLRIGIDDLNANTVTVNFKDIENETVKQIFTSENKITTTLNINSPFTLYNDSKSYQYQITLNYIGSAGKNPFTKAAYITVITYKKKL